MEELPLLRELRRDEEERQMTLLHAFPLPAPFLVPIVAWLVAQTLKIVIALLRRDRSLATYIAPGGMPSVHTATVFATATMVGLTMGWKSPMFGVMVLLCGLVMFDAVVVRTETGKHASALNRLQDHLFGSGELEVLKEDLKEIVGHRPLEILAGLALGVLLGWVFTPAPASAILPYVFPVPTV